MGDNSVAAKDSLNRYIVTLLLLLGSVQFSSCAFDILKEWGPDLEGPWCATRPPGKQCCWGRDDICEVYMAKLNAYCYCDTFCNATALDCCPDYRPFCLGDTTPIPPTTTAPPPRRVCFKDGNRYRIGESIVNNCNKCTCEQSRSSQSGYDWQCTNDVCLVREELIQDINGGRFTWSARNYTKFWGMTLRDGVRYRLGTFLLPEDVLSMTAIRVTDDDSLPESFDSRRKWTNMISPIRDQGNCASSWAHSTAGIASDRLAIESNGTIVTEFSVQNLLSCNSRKQNGCEGGNLDRAWWFLRKKGVVTDKCYPYMSGKTEKTGKCLWPSGRRTGRCPSKIDYNPVTKYKATPPYRIRPDEREIMKEILDNGPVQATFQVHEDFFLYSGGIYRYTSLTRGRPVQYIKSGFHSVRILGWGAERTPDGNIIKYWLCANSWGTDWGENGYFRIQRGTDESRIERYIVGVWGNISGDPKLQQILQTSRRARKWGERKQRQLRTLETRKRRRRHNNNRSRRRRHHPRIGLRNAKTKNRSKSYKKHRKLRKQQRIYASAFFNNSSKNNLQSLEDFFPSLSH